MLIRSTGLEDAAGGLAALKADLGLRLEMKWKDITPSVEERYQMMMDTFLALVRADWIKVRIMFTQNPDRVVLTRAQARTTYHRLYYQFIQWGFGLEHAGMPDGDTRVRLLLDQMPTTAEQVAGFRAHICALTRQPQF
ncbi:MAG: hypothetical protein DYG94_12570 [Leptolyngbya sp. PLA3]|nr:MAG: hypothetical protein EDM82_12885 [Cyanobacteria bacterium CYA]MCE7969560.1 hypothetical protein [Leptolyngbya sp. PL-A3]